ncbi:MAG: pantetheine-phosphate adenylyltransferase [Planctomycetes bacterium]|nr:pantetheine-phosphate adenylyltransferase [Planctomycetota bacterium]
MAATRAVYSGSFDPVTFGHLDIVERAARIFADLEVVVGNNPAKQYVFTLAERVAFLRRAIGDAGAGAAGAANGSAAATGATGATAGGRIRVRAIEHQLLADYAYAAGVAVIVKGVRGIQDYDYERMMHEVNLTQQRGIDTHILLARRELAHISSSAVKELCRYQGFTHEYVPLPVKEALERRLNGQAIVGVTGGIGCGKSFLGERLVARGRARGIAVHNVEFDAIAHDILTARPEPVYAEARAQIAAAFGLATLDRHALGALVFADPEKLTRLNELLRTPLLTRLRAEMAGKQGILLINGALLAEADLLHLCNNNVVLVTAPEGVRMERLRARGLTPEQIVRRLASQYTTDEKRRVIAARIAGARGGAWGRCVEVAGDAPGGAAPGGAAAPSAASDARLDELLEWMQSVGRMGGGAACSSP